MLLRPKHCALLLALCFCCALSAQKTQTAQAPASVQAQTNLARDISTSGTTSGAPASEGTAPETPAPRTPAPGTSPSTPPLVVAPAIPSVLAAPADTSVSLLDRVTGPIESLISSSTDLLRVQLIEVARQYLGVRYVRGGRSEHGFDCSGFVSYVYSKLGIALPRSSASQSQAGQKVDKEATRAGDLVFFYTRGKNIISHVGIYLGNNLFIHSASSGKGVMISSMNEPYWKTRFSRAASFFTEDKK